ncbi:MAG TPA: SRPBCC domain-containing protein, partial [Opitutaceae bacterium]|nr:SRPBCC domain-containing protein [Opitutaceae bacterium]
KHVMRGPDGTEYPNHSVFEEVVKPERIVYSHGGHKQGGTSVSFQSTWTFEDIGGKTRLTMRGVFPSAEERDRVVREFGAVEGAKQTMGRLSDHLCSLRDRKDMAANPADFFISRIFDAPRELVWRAWTEPAMLARWWGPHGFTHDECRVDLRPQGAYRFVMVAPDGAKFPLKGVFLEVVPPERLVMTMDTSEHPEAWFDSILPDRDRRQPNSASMVTTATFAVHERGTQLTVRSRFESAGIRDAFAKHGMSEGWGQSLERLDTLLRSS